MSRNTRIVLIFGGFLAAVGAVFYPIFFHPMMHIEDYKNEQKKNRAGIKQEDVQPPGLTVWTNPFAKK
ncbi:small integral membrane protein 20 [Protopterus annectens]|uniref:small integral membrane protein 20 n=1 Tax=Protopterus annectens TaxID=7888 RepID=UPI001CFB6B9D|nr:small integral membrane protein 20 [Protopterus annectens]